MLSSYRAQAAIAASILGTLLFLGGASVVQAQFLGDATAPSNPNANLEQAVQSIDQLKKTVLFDIAPANPGTGDTVTIKATNPLTPLDQATITWSLNGRTQSRGTGITSFSFTMGAKGASTVTMTALGANGIFMEKSVTFSPGGVDIIWEARTTTPPFYRGKALPSRGAEVVFVALPHITGTSGASLAPTSLLYYWKKDYQPLGNLSGYGRQNITIPGGLLDHASTYTVDVSPINGTEGEKKTGKIVYAPNWTPQIIFYERSPLYGVRYERALADTFSTSGMSTIVRAEPYYFSTDLYTKSARFAWSLNGETVSTPEALTNEVTYTRPSGGGSGSIGLDITASGLFQKAVQKITIFSQPSGR